MKNNNTLSKRVTVLTLLIPAITSITILLPKEHQYLGLIALVVVALAFITSEVLKWHLEKKETKYV